MAEGATVAANQQTAVLEFVGVSKVFRARGAFGKGRRQGIVAAHDVNLAVEPGTAVGLIGESGSGKSTLARLALGLIKPDEGKILVGGRDLAGAPDREWRAARRQIHLIFQDPYDALSARMRVRDLVAEPLVIHGVGTGAGTGDGKGGRRAQILRALVLEPRLIVADEPTSMLDVSLRAGLLRTMLELRAEHGIAFLFITHDLALAHFFCDRLAVMFRGRLVEVGPAEDVVAQPRHPYTRALMQAVRDLEVPESEPLALPVVSAGTDAEGCQYRDRCLLAHEACAVEPTLRTLRPGHSAACHLEQPDKEDQ